VRHSDAEIKRFYDAKQEKIFCMEAGQVLFADTNAWHKGLRATVNKRAMLEFEFTACIEQAYLSGRPGNLPYGL
jgi:hypothetical protein